MLRRLLVLATLAVGFALLSGSAQSSPQGCVWAGRVYPDAEKKVNGKVCQICNNGKWIDRKAKCSECTPTTKPEVTNPAPSPSQCTAQHQPESPQKLTFSDGAWVEQQSGKFQVCSAGVWQDKELQDSVACDK